MDLIVLGRIESRGGHLDTVAKAVPLVTYLAENGPCSRAAIARLFWPTAAKPQAALSTTLWRIRQKAPDVVEADSRWLQTAVTTDMAAFTAAVRADDPVMAANIYGGDLLPDCEYLDIGAEVQEWIIDQRRFLAKLAYDCAVSLAPTKPATADRIFALVGGGQDQRVDEHRRDPTATQSHVIDDVGRAATASTQLATCGREGEIRALREVCRPGHAVNLTGPRGVGKTVLLAEFEKSLGSSAQCATLDLDAASDDLVRETSELADLVERSRWVLVDNAPGDATLEDWAKQARRRDAAVIIASRVPLRAPGVSTFRLKGLSTTTNDSDSNTLSPAAQLIADVATRRSGVDVSAEPSDRGDLERLATLAGGFPKALELLGAWLSLYRPSELITIDEGHEAYLLSAPGFDISVRDYATQVLNANTRSASVAARLSLFADEFDLRSAQRVAGVDTNELLALRELGLVELCESGNLSLIGLLRLTGRALLDANPSERNQAENAYVACVVGWLDGAKRSLTEAIEPVAQQVDRQIDDYSRTVHILASQQRWDEAVEFVDTLAGVLLKLGRASDLRTTMERIVGSNDETTASTPGQRLVNLASAHLATAMCYFDEHEETIAFCDETLDRLDDDEFDCAAILYRAKSLMLTDKGDFNALVGTQKLAHHAASRGTDERLKVLTQWDLAITYTGLGQLDESNRLLHNCIASSRELGDRVIEAFCYLQLARNVIAADPPQALVSIETAREAIRPLGTYYQLVYLEAEARRNYGEPQAAKDLYLEAQACAQGVDNVQFDSAVAVRLATVEMELGNAAAVGDLLASGLEGLAQSSGWPDVLQAMADTAAVLLDTDPNNELALSAYAFAIDNDRFPSELKAAYPPRAGRGDATAITNRLDAACETVLRLHHHLATMTG